MSCRFQKTAALNVRSRLHYSSGGVGSIRQRRAAAGQKPTIANDCLVAVSLRMVRVTDTAICLKVIGHLTRHDVTGRTLEGRAELLSWRQSDHRQDCVIRYARSISF